MAGIINPTGLDIINKAMPLINEDIIAKDQLAIGNAEYVALDGLNEGLRFMYGFEGRTYLKRHVMLQLLKGIADYEVNTANFASDFRIERILEDEVQAANGESVRRMPRDQYIKYTIPYSTADTGMSSTSPDREEADAPRFWFPNPQTKSGGGSIIYFSIFPTVSSDQKLFVPYQVAMTQEIDAATVEAALLIPLQDIDALVYYVADYVGTKDTKPNLGDIRAKLEIKLLESSIAYKLIDESGEFDLSRGMARLAHGGL